MLFYEGTYNCHIWIIFLSPSHFLLYFIFLNALISIQHSLFYSILRFQFSSFQLLSHVWLFTTPWTTAHQVSLSSTNSRSLLKLMSIESVMHPTISSSVIPFSSCLQSFPASGSFQMSHLFTSGGQSIGVSASTSVLSLICQV